MTFGTTDHIQFYMFGNMKIWNVDKENYAQTKCTAIAIVPETVIEGEHASEEFVLVGEN
jgi:hypothetical protein